MNGTYSHHSLSTLLAISREPRQQEAIIIMLFAPAWKQSSRTLGRRVMTTGVPAEEAAASAGLGALVAAVGTTFGTYMLADFLSNFIQHPTQLVSLQIFVCVCVLRCCEMVGCG